MGNSLNTATNIVNQNSVNQVYQSSSSVCNASCNSTISDVNLNITNGSKVGNIDFTQQCTANAVCTLRTSLCTIASQQLASEQAATAQTKSPCLGLWCIDASTNVTNQTLENSTTQVITNVCGATSNLIESNINIGISGSTVGNIDFSQTGDATASCAINNSASATVNQSESSQQSATAISSSWGVITIIVIAVILIILGTAYLNYEKKKGDQEVLIKQNQATADVLKARIQAQAQLKEAGLAAGVSPADLATLGVSSGITPGTFVSATPVPPGTETSGTTAALTGIATSLAAAQLAGTQPRPGVVPGTRPVPVTGARPAPGTGARPAPVTGAAGTGFRPAPATGTAGTGARPGTAATTSLRTPTVSSPAARPLPQTTRPIPPTSSQTTSIRTPATSTRAMSAPATSTRAASAPATSTRARSAPQSSTTSVRTPVSAAS